MLLPLGNLLGIVQPTLRTELLGIFSVHLLVTVGDVGVAGDLGTLRGELSVQLETSTGNDTGEHVRGSRAKTHSLLDTSNVVGTVLKSLVVGGDSGKRGSIDLSHQSLVNLGVLEDVNHDGLELSSSGVGTGEQNKKSLSLEVIHVDTILDITGLEETLEQVTTVVVGVGLVLSNTLINELVTEAHDVTDTSGVTRLGNHVLVGNPGGLDPLGEGVKTAEETEGGETLVEGADKVVNVVTLGNETEGLSEGKLRDNIVGKEANTEVRLQRPNARTANTYVAQAAKSNFLLPAAKLASSLEVHSSMRTSTKVSIGLIAEKAYYILSTSARTTYQSSRYNLQAEQSFCGQQREPCGAEC